MLTDPISTTMLVSLLKTHVFTKTVGCCVGGLFFGTVVLQHVCNVNNWSRSPKTELIRGSRAVEQFAVNLGIYAARLCSYLYHLQLHKLGKAFWDVLGPLLSYLTAPYYFGEGYVRQALTYTSPGVVYLGGIVLIGAAVASDRKSVV